MLGFIGKCGVGFVLDGTISCHNVVLFPVISTIPAPFWDFSATTALHYFLKVGRWRLSLCTWCLHVILSAIHMTCSMIYFVFGL